MKAKFIILCLILSLAIMLNCSKNPLSDRVKELEERVNTMETSVEEKRQDLLKRLNSLEVTSENAGEIANISQELKKEQMTATDISVLESRLVKLEQLVVDWSSLINKSNFKYASYAVLWGMFLPDGDCEVTFLATAFAVNEKTLITNAHVIDALMKFDDDLVEFNNKFDIDVSSYWLLIRNKTTYLRYKSNYFFALPLPLVHDDWDCNNTKSSDVGIFLTWEGSLYYKASLATNYEVYRLKEGQEIATLGFPGELQGGILEDLYPIATFKKGTISAIRPPSPELTGTSNKYIIQHDLDLTGGTSGSPIYDTSGKVIAVNNATIVTPIISFGGLTTISQGSLGFGIRIDKANELLSITSKQIPQTVGIKEEIIETLEGRDIGTLEFRKTDELIEELRNGTFVNRIK